MTFTEILKDQVPSFSRSWLYVPRQAHSNSSVVIYKDGSDAHYIKQLKKWRFWKILVNRKWGDFPYAAKFVLPSVFTLTETRFTGKFEQKST